MSKETLEFVTPPPPKNYKISSTFSYNFKLALTYRLFTLAERRGWAAEAYAYNSLIVAWPDVQSKAAELSAAWSNAEQQTLFTSGEISSGEV